MLPLLAASSAYAYDYGNPTSAEQMHLEAMNRARANPQAEAARMGLSSVFEGVDPGEITGEPLPPLTLNAQLLQAARDHSNDMLARIYFEHNSPEGVSPGTRMTNAGYQWNMMRENLAVQYRESGVNLDEIGSQFLDQLFIDEGVAGRGHRTNILSADTKETGIGIVTGLQAGETLTTYLVTVDFGSSAIDPRNFLTGVVYDDINKNGLYNGGEGIAGVNISTGSETTTTATAGGYGLPLSTGQYTVTITHPSLGSITRNITMAAQNIKLDVLASEFSSPTTDPVSDPVGEPSTISDNTIPEPVDSTGEPSTTNDTNENIDLTAKTQCIASGKAYIQDFTNMSDGCYGLPNEPTEVVANVIYLDTSRTVAPASFRGGVLANNNFVKFTQMGMARLPNASLAFNFQPVIEHVGLTANLLVAVGIEKPFSTEEPRYDGSFDTNYFAFSEDVGEIYPIDLYVDSSGWSNEVAKMQAQPYMMNVKLENAQTTVLVPGDLTPLLQILKNQDVSQAMLYFFIGYALTDGTIVFNERPIIVNVE
jgi:hypothetical protein